MNKPKILLIDIETSPTVAYTWGLWKQNIPIKSIIKPGEILCFSAKWLGQKKIIFYSSYEHGYEVMIKSAIELLDEADAVCHFNGKKFDIPIIMREALKLGIKPPSPFKHIDLLTVVRKNFNFISNKLEFVARELNIGKKVPNRGMELWIECMEGKPSAWKEMKKYCIGDVSLLEKLHNRILPYISSYPNIGLYNTSADFMCTNCGSKKLQKRGIDRTATREYQRYHCTSCGKWLKSSVCEKPTKKVLR